MIYTTDPRSSIRPTAGAEASMCVGTERMTYEIHARRKAEEVWHAIACFTNDEDARAALWAIVFTSKYAEVQVREENSTTPLAEWPAGLAPLR